MSPSGRLATVTAVLSLALVSGCGSDDEKGSGSKPAEKATPTEAPVKDKGPYELTCADVKNTQAATITRQGSFALADEIESRDASRLQLAESIWFGMNEVCKSEADDHRPAKDAVKGVESGKYEANLGAP